MPHRKALSTAIVPAAIAAPPSRMLGTTGPRVGLVGQGTTRVGNRASRSEESVQARVRTLRLGIELGMNLVDTAELYGGGHAEEVVAEAIRGIRSNVVLASKFLPGHSTRDEIVRAAEGSLRRLDTDYLDLYQTHWPNALVPTDETFEALSRLVDAGKVRCVGLSNVTVIELASARKIASPLPIVSVQTEYSLTVRDPEFGLIQYCADTRITVLAYSIINGSAELIDARQRDLLDGIAGRYGVTVSQLLLAWVLRNPDVIALVKAADDGVYIAKRKGRNCVATA